MDHQRTRRRIRRRRPLASHARQPPPAVDFRGSAWRVARRVQHPPVDGWLVSGAYRDAEFFVIEASVKARTLAHPRDRARQQRLTLRVELPDRWGGRRRRRASSCARRSGGGGTAALGDGRNGTLVARRKRERAIVIAAHCQLERGVLLRLERRRQDDIVSPRRRALDRERDGGRGNGLVARFRDELLLRQRRLEWRAWLVGQHNNADWQEIAARRLRQLDRERGRQ